MQKLIKPQIPLLIIDSVKRHFLKIFLFTADKCVGSLQLPKNVSIANCSNGSNQSNVVMHTAVVIFHCSYICTYMCA